MRRLHFGGSFNPVHCGHLIAARAVAETAGFEQIVLVPTHVSPHKGGKATVSMADRLEMCRRAVGGDPLFDIDSIEADRPGPSYTIDTADELRRRGASDVFWLIGADMAATLPTWHQADRLLEQVNFVLMGRHGWSLDLPSLPERARGLTSTVVTTPLIDISSTTVRRRVAAGLSVRYLTPSGVVDYIAERGLYRDGSVLP